MLPVTILISYRKSPSTNRWSEYFLINVSHCPNIDPNSIQCNIRKFTFTYLPAYVPLKEITRRLTGEARSPLRDLNSARDDDWSLTYTSEEGKGFREAAAAGLVRTTLSLLSHGPQTKIKWSVNTRASVGSHTRKGLRVRDDLPIFVESTVLCIIRSFLLIRNMRKINDLLSWLARSKKEILYRIPYLIIIYFAAGNDKRFADKWRTRAKSRLVAALL